VTKGLTGLTDKGLLRVREVFADNLDEEFKLIRDAVEDFPFVAMDTEFPGVSLLTFVECVCVRVLVALARRLMYTCLFLACFICA